MRRTTKIILGVFAGTLLTVVAVIGILSRSNPAVKEKQTRSEGFRELAVDVSGVKTIVLQASDGHRELPGELTIRGGNTENRTGMLRYTSRLEAFLKQEVKGDTLFLSLVPADISQREVTGKIGFISIKLYAGAVTDVVDGWSLHTVVNRLDADTLKLKTNAGVALDSCNIRVLSLEQLRE